MCPIHASGIFRTSEVDAVQARQAGNQASIDPMSRLWGRGGAPLRNTRETRYPTPLQFDGVPQARMVYLNLAAAKDFKSETEAATMSAKRKRRDPECETPELSLKWTASRFMRNLSEADDRALKMFCACNCFSSFLGPGLSFSWQNIHLGLQKLDLSRPS